MYWPTVSLPNPFKSLQENEEKPSEEEEQQQQESPSHGGRGGVKEDLSELGKTIGRQLWGVASFLAPPPVTVASNSVDSTDPSSQTILGIRNDFAEIGGSFKSGLSLLSTTKAVNEISRLATNLLQLPKEDGDELTDGVVGVTEEVLEFVRVMSIRPECWTDFPLSLDNSDFHISDVQREHASNVEHLTPSLAALRAKLCPDHMNEGHFWMIYFILLHPRLNEHESKLLSTPQIVEARDVLLQKLQNRMSTELQISKADDLIIEVSSKGSDIGEECNPVQEKEVVAQTVNAAHQVNVDEQENVDQWLEEEDVETGNSVDTRRQLGNEEDVSFSDLEDDDNDAASRQVGSSPVQNDRVSSSNGSSGWDHLSENSDTGAGRKKAVQPTSREKDSEGEESNDWLTVDDFDSDNVGTA